MEENLFLSYRILREQGKHFLMTEGGGHCREGWDMTRSDEVIEKGPEAADMVGQSVAKITPPAGLEVPPEFIA